MGCPHKIVRSMLCPSSVAACSPSTVVYWGIEVAPCRACEEGSASSGRFNARANSAANGSAPSPAITTVFGQSGAPSGLSGEAWTTCSCCISQSFSTVLSRAGSSSAGYDAAPGAICSASDVAQVGRISAVRAEGVSGVSKHTLICAGPTGSSLVRDQSCASLPVSAAKHAIKSAVCCPGLCSGYEVKSALARTKGEKKSV